MSTCQPVGAVARGTARVPKSSPRPASKAIQTGRSSLPTAAAAPRAIAWTTGCRLLGISSCEAIARGTAAAVGRLDHPVWIAFDAGRGELFGTRAEPRPTTPTGWHVHAGVILPAAAWLAAVPAGAVVSGPGLVSAGEALDARPDLLVAPSTAWSPAIADVAAGAKLRAAAGEADDPAGLVPDYIRPSYAEESAPPLSPPPDGGTIGPVFKP
ncbi:MAG: hypothetical protein ACKOTB_03765 [Planctomycetia bacterium]